VPLNLIEMEGVLHGKQFPFHTRTAPSRLNLNRNGCCLPPGRRRY